MAELSSVRTGAEADALGRGRDPAVHSSVLELISLADKVTDIGRHLSLSLSIATRDRGEEALAVAIRAVRCRRRRDRMLGGELFTDPLWNVLLDLYIAEGQSRQVSISSACIATGVPPTSALRCCRMIEERGFAIREPDPADRRRIFLRLTASCHESMTQILLESAQS